MRRRGRRRDGGLMSSRWARQERLRGKRERNARRIREEGAAGGMRKAKETLAATSKTTTTGGGVVVLSGHGKLR